MVGKDNGGNRERYRSFCIRGWVCCAAAAMVLEGTDWLEILFKAAAM